MRDGACWKRALPGKSSLTVFRFQPDPPLFSLSFQQLKHGISLAKYQGCTDRWLSCWHKLEFAEEKMRSFSVLLLITATAVPCIGAQQQNGAAAKGRVRAESNSQLEARSGGLALQQGTEIEAQLKSSLDLKKAKMGDRFTMRTTRDVKNNGRKILSKGSLITGHIEQVQRSETETIATLAFDQVVDPKNGLSASLQATIVGVTERMNEPVLRERELIAIERESPPGSRGSSRQPSGGLLGGVVGAATSATGQILGSAETTTRSTAGVGAGLSGTSSALTRNRLRIVPEISTEQVSETTLALVAGRSRIESSTVFFLKSTSEYSSIATVRLVDASSVRSGILRLR
jgi:hypothetical protein